MFRIGANRLLSTSTFRCIPGRVPYVEKGTKAEPEPRKVIHRNDHWGYVGRGYFFATINTAE